jgi:CRP-like cAMP-binding protein
VSRFYKKIEKTFAKGEIIFSEDHECDGMYIIDKGSVRVFKTLDTPAGLKELELVRLGPKSLFGEMALIDDKKRSASVQAVEETICTIITKKMFEDQLEQLPPWVVNLIRVLVSRLRETNDKLREKAKEYHDDTGGLVYIDEKANSLAAEMTQKLERSIDKAEKKLQTISESIEDVRNNEFREISKISSESLEKIKNSSGKAPKTFAVNDSDEQKLNTLNLDKIPEESIKEIKSFVNRLDKHNKKTGQ